MKIYSHRVDDVHLSSYKVLANLNRTGPSDKDMGGDRGGLSGEEEEDDDDDGRRRVRSKKKTKSKARGEATLASNVGKFSNL